MSYILEALRKAEQQHHTEHSPALVSPQQYPLPVRQLRQWKRWVVFIFMLNGAVIAILIGSPSRLIPSFNAVSPVSPPPLPLQLASPVDLLPKAMPPVVIPISPIVVEKTALVPPPAAPVANKTPTKPVVAPAPAPKPSAVPVKATTAVVLPAVLPPQPEPVAISLRPQEAPLPEPAVVATPPAPPETTPAYRQLPTLDELPIEFQRALPPLPINVFVYHTEPQQRFVLIGMRKYQEGQVIQGGPVLEAITPDSLILHQAGRYFRIIRP